ncbi:MAG: hypothetical protein ACFB5Z_09900 [Elainellaceae cyanobacterium]
MSRLSMRWFLALFCLFVLVSSSLDVGKSARAQSAQPVTPIDPAPALEIQSTRVRHLNDLNLLVFEQQLGDTAGSALPQPAGQLDGAPVLGYVFPTTLAPEDVGFNAMAGIVALAVTSHPDFDDTPLWDEDGDRDYANDGACWHSHWVVLGSDERVPGGLSVQEFSQGDAGVTLPPTHPDMPMYIDSPGFAVVTEENVLRVLVPEQRVNYVTDFSFDAVAAYMQVNTSDASLPMLGVYEVYSVSSGDLSLPYRVQEGES